MPLTTKEESKMPILYVVSALLMNHADAQQFHTMHNHSRRLREEKSDGFSSFHSPVAAEVKRRRCCAVCAFNYARGGKLHSARRVIAILILSLGLVESFIEMRRLHAADNEMD
jgi:hypothetical protein